MAPPEPPPPFKPIAIRAQVLRWWLAATVVVDVIAIAFDASHLNLLDPDSFAGNDAVVASDARLTVATLALVVTFLVSIVLWLLWFHRAYRNLPSLGAADLRFGTRWSVGAWFVPILSLFRPKQIANDLWRGTDPAAPWRDPAWPQRRVSPLVHWWWAVFLAATALGNFSSELMSSAETLGEERAAVALDMVAAAAFVATGVLAVLFVRAVTERAAARLAALHGPETDAAPPPAGRLLRRPAAVGLSLAGAGLLVFVVSVAGPVLLGDEPEARGGEVDDRPVSVFELRVGQCLNGLSENSVARFAVATPCEEPHRAEVISNFSLPDGPWPGEDEVIARAEERCDSDLLALAAPERNGPTPYYLFPVAQSWAAGDRAVTCFAFYDAPHRGALDAG